MTLMREGGARIVLASGSPARRSLMENAGLRFEVVISRVDEDAVREALGDADPADVAELLARAKAEDVVGRGDAQIVIGADQVLALDDTIFTKPRDMVAAREQLLALKGRRHQLHSAVVLMSEDQVSFVHTESVDVTMRDYSPEFVGRYLAAAGGEALDAVGCYQIEGLGLQLIEAISGDYFAVLGLPMLPLLAEFRRLKVLDA